MMVSFVIDDSLARAFLINKSDYLRMPFVNIILIQHRLLFELVGSVKRFSFVLIRRYIDGFIGRSDTWFHL